MNLGDITFNHIRILKAVDSCHGFSQAAKELGYSQALVSKKVKQLEEYFGTPLITRTPGASQLTNHGKRLISRTLYLCEDLEILKQDIGKPIDSLGEEVVVGITPLLSASWLKRFFHRFSMCFPDKKIVTVEAAGNSLFSGKQGDNIDLAINNLSAYQEDHPCTRLQTYRLVFIDLDRNGSHSGRGPIGIDDINFSDLLILDEIRQELLRGSAGQSGLINASKLVDHYEELLRVLVTSHGSTILPEFCLEDIPNISKDSWTYIHDLSEFGVYIHVPPLSELLVLAEG
jgi:molybdate transport repressor ModE-like protein